MSGPTAEIRIDYSRLASDPRVTLRLSLDEIEDLRLSVAERETRNRSQLYQRKHASRAAGWDTRQRDPALAALNRPIAEHYQLQSLCHGLKGLENKRVLAVAVSDLTANPLRPHYDATSDDPRRSLFFLADEPIGQVPYTLLICYQHQGRIRLGIQHDVQVGEDGALPDSMPAEMRNGLRYWMACPPLLINGQHDLEAFCLRDYDLRHVFGFRSHFKEFGYRSEQKYLEELYKVYELFPDWERWCAAIGERLKTLPKPETCYHAALGLSEQELLVIHRTCTIPELAEELRRLGAGEAVLLDSGGSCAIWANWVNGNRGGVLASAWNFREARGAVLFIILKGERGLPAHSR